MTDSNITVTNRGFKHHEPIPHTYGGSVRVYESSAASGPHIWLRVTDTIDHNKPEQESVAHLSLEQAIRVRDALTYIIENHYQVQWDREDEDS